jgi:ketosteroid isomerase-like protein
MTGVTIGVLSPADNANIMAVTERFRELMLAQDFDSLALLYTEDAVLMPPHQPAVRGRAAIREWAAAFPTVSRFEVSIDEVDGRADLAYVRGTSRRPSIPRGVRSRSRTLASFWRFASARRMVPG